MLIPVKAGDKVTCTKTVSESDVYLFAGITGDFAPNHVDEAYMRGTSYGRRIAHGALIVGYMSRLSTLISEQAAGFGAGVFPVSLGYDKVRFLGPVFIGDTIAFSYVISEIDSAKRRSIATVDARNEKGELVTVATHVMKWLTR